MNLLLPGEPVLTQLWSDDSPAESWQAQYPSREVLFDDLRKFSKQLCDLFEALPPNDLKITYSTTSGRSITTDVRGIFAHVFNHATHHRGQISACMTILHLPFPALDLLYFLIPDA